MSNDYFDIDAILAEFSSFSSELSGRSVPEETEGAPAQSFYEAEPFPVQTEPVSFEEPRDVYPEETLTALREEPLSEADDEPFIPRKGVPFSDRDIADDEEEEEEDVHRGFKLPAVFSRRRQAETEDNEAELEDDEADEDGREPVRPEEVQPEKLRIGALRHVLAIVFAAAALLALLWTAGNIHPDIGVSETMRTDAKLDLVSKIDVFANNSKSDALGDLAYIRKIYTIDRSAPCGPKPNPNGYLTYSISDAGQVTELIDRARASGLLEGQDVIFDPNAEFYWDSDIRCYYDETILVICWKEVIERRVCSCVEVKIADASQFRRKLTEDYFGSSVTQYTTQMAASVNAVTAMNADFYSFRPYGIVAYQGEIYRYNTAVDTLLIDDQGDFSFMHRFDDPGQEAMQQRVYEDHIQFSLAFGPVLIEDGVVQYLTDNYGGVGEMHMEYSRAAIGQFDKLHYLYMTVNHSNDGTPRAKVNEMANIIATKNVRQAYNLDGGQTSEIVFNGTPYNHIDFGNERLMSDCIYFCTAIPESEVSR